MQASNALNLSGDYDAHEIAELIHLEGAEALGTYRSDFYAGRPALTVNRFGEGNAYHLATRVKDAFFLLIHKSSHHNSVIEITVRKGLIIL